VETSDSSSIIRISNSAGLRLGGAISIIIVFIKFTVIQIEQKQNQYLLTNKFVKYNTFMNRFQFREPLHGDSSPHAILAVKDAVSMNTEAALT
jgi:hypothetical protein